MASSSIRINMLLSVAWCVLSCARFALGLNDFASGPLPVLSYSFRGDGHRELAKQLEYSSQEEELDERPQLHPRRQKQRGQWPPREAETAAVPLLYDGSVESVEEGQPGVVYKDENGRYEWADSGSGFVDDTGVRQTPDPEAKGGPPAYDVDGADVGETAEPSAIAGQLDMEETGKTHRGRTSTVEMLLRAEEAAASLSQDAAALSNELQALGDAAVSDPESAAAIERAGSVARLSRGLVHPEALIANGFHRSVAATTTLVAQPTPSSTGAAAAAAPPAPATTSGPPAAASSTTQPGTAPAGNSTSTASPNQDKSGVLMTAFTLNKQLTTPWACLHWAVVCLFWCLLGWCLCRCCAVTRQ